MAIKIECDICGSQKDTITCLQAGADLCGKHHVEFHDKMRPTINKLLDMQDEKRLEILNEMSNARKTGSVTPIR